MLLSLACWLWGVQSTPYLVLKICKKYKKIKYCEINSFCNDNDLYLSCSLFIAKILNDLKLINCPGITEGVLLYYYVGSRVGGKIYFGNNPGWGLPSSLDKSQYTKEIRDALEKGSEEAGFDLDV